MRCSVRAGPAPDAVVGLPLPLLVLLVGLLLTAIAVAVAVTIVRRNAAVRHLDVENRALDDALERQLAIEAELRGVAGSLPHDPAGHARRDRPLRPE